VQLGIDRAAATSARSQIGGVGGAILLVVAGYIKNMMAKT
jgi:hypothetical protein